MSQSNQILNGNQLLDLGGSHRLETLVVTKGLNVLLQAVRFIQEDKRLVANIIDRNLRFLHQGVIVRQSQKQLFFDQGFNRQVLGRSG